jgi:hypothetical protein
MTNECPKSEGSNGARPLGRFNVGGFHSSRSFTISKFFTLKRTKVRAPALPRLTFRSAIRHLVIESLIRHSGFVIRHSAGMNHS